MAMMNDAIATLVNTFNNADRSQSDNMIDIAATTAYHFTEHNGIVLGVSQKNRAPLQWTKTNAIIKGGVNRVMNTTIG